MFGIDDAIAGVFSLAGGERANQASAKQAAQQRSFQDYESSTAHQREVADLRKAGLNPILSGTGGSGASTPAGAMAQQSDTVTPAIATAMQSSRNKAEVKNLEASAKKTDAQARQENQWADLYEKGFPHVIKGIEAIVGGAKSFGETLAAIKVMLENFKPSSLIPNILPPPPGPVDAARAASAQEEHRKDVAKDKSSGTPSSSARERGVNPYKRPMRIPGD